MKRSDYLKAHNKKRRHNMTEEQDPQDNAVLSDDMTEPKVEQQEIKVKSIYEGLVEIGKLHGTLYGTNKKHADMMRFDLTGHSVFVGHTFIVLNGKVKKPVLETASAKIDITGLPWLTALEKTLDPQVLFMSHYMSRPNGSEKYVACNFPAKDVDEMTDDEIAYGMPRNEARVRLEAWILCASMDGSLAHYVQAQPTYRPDSWFWSPTQDKNGGQQLVIKADWWREDTGTDWVLYPTKDRYGDMAIAIPCGFNIVLPRGFYAVNARTIQMAPRLLNLCKTLSQTLFSMQMRFKCHDTDPIVCEANRMVEYIETGKNREK